MNQQRIPQLDGLRGIAILGVLLFHFDFDNVGPHGLGVHLPGTQFGWSGVVLFFALSGYLITQILLSTKAHPQYFKNFYFRRALRIFPAYYLLLILSYAAIYSFTPPLKPRASLMNEWVMYATYLSNYWPALQHIKTPASLILEITWTLSVEEQFYWLWPLVVWFCSPRALCRVCIGLLLASPLLRLSLFSWTGDASLTSASFTSNLDALALGALIATARAIPGWSRFMSLRAGWLALMSAGGALLCVFNIFGMDYFANVSIWMQSTFNLLFFPFFVALFYAGVLVVALESRGKASKWLQFKPLVALGRISYGVYLYHMLVNYVVLRFVWTSIYLPLPDTDPDPMLIPLVYLARYCLTLLLAVISYRYLEQPVLRLSARFVTPRTTSAILGADTAGARA